MVYPLLPAFLAALGGGPIALGAMEALADGALTLLKGAAGRWSDRQGRRKPWVSAGYGLSAATRPLMALAGSAAQVIGLRVIDRVAKGLRTAPRDALIAEATPAADRAYAFSFHRGLDHLGAAVGPLLAALVLLAAPGQLRWVFAAATLPALGGWLTVVFFTREPRRAAVTERPGGNTGWMPPPGLRAPLAAFFLFSLGNASDAFLLLRAAEMGYSAVGLTVLWSGFHVVKWLASAPAGRLADRFGTRRLILFGWSIYALVYLGFARVDRWIEIAVLFAAYALYYGLTEGAERALVVRLAGRAAGAGASLGAFHFATGLGTVAASLLFGAIWALVAPSAAFRAGAALAAVASVSLALATAARR
jgi:MFS family permease